MHLGACWKQRGWGPIPGPLSHKAKGIYVRIFFKGEFIYFKGRGTERPEPPSGSLTELSGALALGPSLATFPGASVCSWTGKEAARIQMGSH